MSRILSGVLSKPVRPGRRFSRFRTNRRLEKDPKPFADFAAALRRDREGARQRLSGGSYLPGVDRVAFSGTSMASPQVVNLAGKTLTINPALTPTQVIDIIVSTSDTTSDGRRTLIPPRKALELVRQKKG